MSRGVNKVIIIGNLGADPEIRYSSNGSAVANIRVATSDSWKDKQTGETQERTEWHKVVLYNRLGDVAKDYLKKGAKVFIEGSLKTNKWQDQSGNERYTTEIVANNMQMLDSRGVSSSNQDNTFQASTQNPKSNSKKNHQPVESDTFDDDIPF